MTPSKAEVIIVGAGRGMRMGAAVPKIFLPLGPRPVLAHTVAAFLPLPEIDGLVLVVPAGEEGRVREICRALPGYEKIRAVVAGGGHRQDSVRAGLNCLRPDTEVVLVQDAARPFSSPDLIRRVLAASLRCGAAVPGVPVADTLRQVRPDGTVVRTLDRSELVAVQTPQGFRHDVLRRAFEHAERNRIQVTDDAGLVEQAGLPVAVVTGDPMNLKLTTPQDFRLAEALWTSRGAAAGENGGSSQ